MKAWNVFEDEFALAMMTPTKPPLARHAGIDAYCLLNELGLNLTARSWSKNNVLVNPVRRV